MRRRVAVFVSLSAAFRVARGDAVDDRLATLSAKELRWLGRKYGLDDELRFPIEKGEIRALLAEVIRGDEARARSKVRWAWIKRCVFTALAVLVGAVAWEPLATYARTCGFLDFWRSHASMTRHALEAGAPAAAAAIVLSALLDVAATYLRFTIILAWVVPRDVSRWFAIPMPSFPLDPGTLLGSKPSGYSLNMAPMVISYAVRWVQHRLENFAGREMQAVYGASRRRERTSREAMRAALEEDSD